MTPGAVSGPVVVIGAGLVGASVGCALTAAGVTVHLEDRNPSHARVAAGVGGGRLDPPVPTDVRLVVVAVPPKALPAVIADALSRFPHATVTDVGSIKGDVLDQLWRSGADRRRYVGSHPMAGSQLSGPLTARADLFVDRTWVVTPHRESAPDRVEQVSALVRVCRAREVVMDVDDHDAAVARVSHLPHLVSVLMAGHLTTVPEPQLRLAGQGLRDVTRIAGSDPKLWLEIVAGNAAALVPELKAVHAELGGLIDAVEADPQAGVEPYLTRAVTGTRRIPGKHGQAPTDYATVVVEIPDQPGVLGQLFTDAGAAGANVEDLSIEHDQVRQVGYLSIAVVADTADALADAMRGAGWTVSVAVPAPGERGANGSDSVITLTVVSSTPSHRSLVIAIDGPSGSGKSSTARGVAARLDLDYLDTGAMYRAATWRAVDAGVDLTDAEAVAELVSGADLIVSLDPQAPSVVIDGHDVTTAIREPEVSAAVSKVATNLAVRRHLVAEQQRVIAGSERGIVAEGRDITTVVARDADLRLLLVADPTARVGRRHTELAGKASTAEVTDQVLRRDRDDSTVSQFEQATDGVTTIDSTHLDLTEVIDVICDLVAQVPAAGRP